GFGGVGIEPDPRENVGEVDPGRAHANADFAFTGNRIRPLPHREDLGPAVPRDNHLAHSARRVTSLTEGRCPSDSPTRALAGTPAPRSDRVARSLRSLASF